MNGSTDTAGGADTGWDALVTAALLGTQRRQLDLSALPAAVADAAAHRPSEVDGGDDPAVLLLDAAALATAYRRAGRRPLPAPEPPAAAPDEGTPQVGPAAAARLAGLLEGGDVDLLGEWLRAAAAAGSRVPAELLPALLDTARRHAAIAPEAIAVIGCRGEWLAGLRPEWSRLLAAHPAAAAATPAAPEDDDGRVWTHGGTPTRRRYFARLRAADPAAALDLLERSWLGETGEDRAALLVLLETGLSDADEPLLERALDDRRRDVRDGAALLLSRLPDSAFGARMADRAGRCVAVQRRHGRPRIVVTPPSDCDTAMRRDGVRPTPELPGVGERAFWLRQVVAATPLRHWPRLLGDRSWSPARILALPVDGDWADMLRAGWTDAAVRQRDPQWAAALLPVAARDHVRLLEVVPEADRGAAVVALLGSLDLTVDSPDAAAAALLATCPAPWPRALADAVLAQLSRASGDPQRYGVREALRLAALRLPPQRSGEVLRAARALPEAALWRPVLTSLADTLTLRHDMLEEIR